MRKIAVLPNPHLPNAKFTEWAKNLSKFNLETVLFELENRIFDWKDILKKITEFHEKHLEKGKELYYLTEGWGLLLLLEAVESGKISGVFSIQPIIARQKKYKAPALYKKAKNPKYLLERTGSAIHLFLPEKNFENDHKKTVKILKKMKKPNISVQTYDSASLLSDRSFEEIQGYILYNLGIR